MSRKYMDILPAPKDSLAYHLLWKENINSINIKEFGKKIVVVFK